MGRGLSNPGIRVSCDRMAECSNRRSRAGLLPPAEIQRRLHSLLSGAALKPPNDAPFSEQLSDAWGDGDHGDPNPGDDRDAFASGHACMLRARRFRRQAFSGRALPIKSSLESERPQPGTAIRVFLFTQGSAGLLYPASGSQAVGYRKEAVNRTREVRRGRLPLL